MWLAVFLRCIGRVGAPWRQFAGYFKYSTLLCVGYAALTADGRASMRSWRYPVQCKREGCTPCWCAVRCFPCELAYKLGPVPRASCGCMGYMGKRATERGRAENAHEQAQHHARGAFYAYGVTFHDGSHVFLALGGVELYKGGTESAAPTCKRLPVGCVCVALKRMFPPPACPPWGSRFVHRIVCRLGMRRAKRYRARNGIG